MTDEHLIRAANHIPKAWIQFDRAQFGLFDVVQLNAPKGCS